MKIRISDIQVKTRIRIDLGDIDRLCDNMRKNGLINPIVVNKDKTLVSGQRRLQAAKLLGWDEIEATVVDATEPLRLLELELDENTHRKDFTTEEIERGIRRRLEYIRVSRLSPFGRFFHAIRRAVENFFRWIVGKRAL
ncbi:unnamed protein product [marine sediment metagenome]|uniref:ParB-like N-terminal domain-containing protein n=1 Tax=marine sediment metagenome TaxID=412755 RepID=X0XQJ0_9ZZZZ